MDRTFLLSCGHMQIPCNVFGPDFGDVRQCIIGVHGFGGTKDSPVLTSISEDMGFFCAVTVCFDLPAHGENRVTDQRLTLNNCLNALKITVCYYSNKPDPYIFCNP